MLRAHTYAHLSLKLLHKQERSPGKVFLDAFGKWQARPARAKEVRSRRRGDGE